MQDVNRLSFKIKIDKIYLFILILFALLKLGEILEETNLEIKNIVYQTVTNEIMLYENKHYVDIFMKAEVIDENAEPVVRIKFFNLFLW